jgi:hypothetical protein
VAGKQGQDPATPQRSPVVRSDDQGHLLHCAIRSGGHTGTDSVLVPPANSDSPAVCDKTTDAAVKRQIKSDSLSCDLYFIVADVLWWSHLVVLVFPALICSPAALVPILAPTTTASSNCSVVTTPSDLHASGARGILSLRDQA